MIRALHSPAPAQPAPYLVTVRSIDGLDTEIPADSLDTAHRIAHDHRTACNYMVCIVHDGERILRWDSLRIRRGRHERSTGAFNGVSWRRVRVIREELIGPAAPAA